MYATTITTATDGMLPPYDTAIAYSTNQRGISSLVDISKLAFTDDVVQP